MVVLTFGVPPGRLVRGEDHGSRSDSMEAAHMSDKPERAPVRGKHRRPSAKELDERVSVDLDPEEFVDGLLRAGPHPEDDPERRRPRNT
jgi:hypothetical protein